MIEQRESPAQDAGKYTCYIDRSKVREILIEQPDVPAETTSYILHDIDQLPIFTAEDFAAPLLPPGARAPGYQTGATYAEGYRKGQESMAAAPTQGATIAAAHEAEKAKWLKTRKEIGRVGFDRGWQCGRVSGLALALELSAASRTPAECSAQPSPSDYGHCPGDRDIEKHPYLPDEKRVAKWFYDAGVGGGNDPIGSMIASHEYLAAERNQLRSQVENVRAKIEALPRYGYSPTGICPIRRNPVGDYVLRDEAMRLFSSTEQQKDQP